MWRRYWALPFVARLGGAVWIVLIVAVVVRVLVARPTSKTVLPVDLAAGERWLAGTELYAPVIGLDAYRNPPGVAALFAPLSWLPPKLAGLLWRLLMAAIFLTGLRRLRRRLWPDLSPGRIGLIWATSALLAVPSLNNGQLNLLIAGTGLHAAASASALAAGTWLAAGVALKVYPVAALGLLGLRRPRRLLAAVPAMVALFALPFACQHPAYVAAEYGHFVEWLGFDDRTHSTWDRTPRDWTVLPRAWLGEVVSAATAQDVSIVVALMMAGLTVLHGRTPGASPLLPLLLATLWMTLFGPATEANTYCLLAGVAPLFLFDPTPRPRWITGLAALGVAGLAAGVLRGALPGDRAVYAMGPHAAAAGVLLMGVVLEVVRGVDRQLRREGQRE